MVTDINGIQLSLASNSLSQKDLSTLSIQRQHEQFIYTHAQSSPTIQKRQAYFRVNFYIMPFCLKYVYSTVLIFIYLPIKTRKGR